MNRPNRVPDFSQLPARIKQIKRWSTIDDSYGQSKRLERTTNANVTPVSGVKSKRGIQYSAVKKCKLLQKHQDNSMIELSAREKTLLKNPNLSCFEKPSKKLRNLISHKLLSKKSYKKVKVKKCNPKKKCSSKKIRSGRKENSRASKSVKRNFWASNTFDDTMSSKFRNDWPTPSRQDILGGINALKSTKAAKVFSKNVKSFITNWNGISEKYCKPPKDKSVTKDVSHIYSRKFSSKIVKPSNVQIAVNIQGQLKKPKLAVDYRDLCLKLRKGESSINNAYRIGNDFKKRPYFN